MFMSWIDSREWRVRCQQNWGVPPALDLWDFVRSRRELAGAFPVSVCNRALEGLPEQPLVRSVSSIADDEAGVVWFELKGLSQVGGRSGLELRLQARINLICQRCLDRMWLDVVEQVRFDVVTQKQLENLDHEESDPDEAEMLVGSRQFDVFGLIEDQLILAIPYVPKHDRCPERGLSSPAEKVQDSKPSPFGVLEHLKRKDR